MTTPRFYVTGQDLRSGRFILRGGEHHHASRVLRMRGGEGVILMDGRGGLAHGVVEEMAADHASLIMREPVCEDEELPRLHVFQGLPRGSRMDGVVQAGVEFGAASIIPVECARSQPADKPARKRVERWRRIALESSRVAGRAYLPDVTGIMCWDEAFTTMQSMDIVLFADETGGVRPASALDEKEAMDLALVIGPEGGFDKGERRDLVAAGALAVTLGRHVLRAQTAGLALLAAVRCHYGLL